MRLVFGWAAVAALSLVGCEAAKTDPAVMATSAIDNAASPATSDGGIKPAEPVAAEAGPAGEASAAPASPVPIEAGKVNLTPENTKIEFVGVHLPPKQPDPRTGGFEKFSGVLEVDAAAKALKSINVEIDATSLWTQVGGKLTTHLKNPDFLEVEEFPQIKLESTKIEPGQGECQVTGRLTLHGETKEIKFPAKVEITDGGIVLRTQFEIDRAEFGMKKLLDSVGNKVALTVVVGEKNQPRQGGGKGGGKGKRGKPTS